MSSKRTSARKSQRKSAATQKAATARKTKSSRASAASTRKAASARKSRETSARETALSRSSFKTNVKRKRYTPAKSAEDEAGLVKFTTLLEATPRAKVAKLTENPVYNATNMTTIKNYLRMKGMRMTGRKYELVQRMHNQILKEKEAAYGPPADLNDDGRTLRSETEAYLAAVRTGLTDDEADNNDNAEDSASDDEQQGVKNGAAAAASAATQEDDDQEMDEDDNSNDAPVATRLTFGAALSPIGDRSGTADEEEDIDSRRHSAASPFMPTRIAAPSRSSARGLKGRAESSGSAVEESDNEADNEADAEPEEMVDGNDGEGDESGTAQHNAVEVAGDAAESDAVEDDAIEEQPLVLQHHVVDVTHDATFQSWHLPKIVLVALLFGLLLLHAESSFKLFGWPQDTIASAAGWGLVMTALTAVYLSGNES